MDEFRSSEAFEAGQKAFREGRENVVPKEFEDLEKARVAFRQGWRWARDCALHYT